MNQNGEFVLYWMIANRRSHWNFSLQRAVEWAVELRKPLVILEALRCGYRWASDRIHGFIIDGMADNAESLAKSPVYYYPYLEREANQGKGLLAALSAQACVVVTDHFPEFFLPRMVSAAARQLTVRLEQVDSNGLLPLRAADQAFPTAFSFRRFLQKNLPVYLQDSPRPNPLESITLPTLKGFPDEITQRWPMATVDTLKAAPDHLSRLPIDHAVPPSWMRGGAADAQAALQRFLREGLPRYVEERNQPQEDVTSGLSPYLHFGHISAHQVFHALMEMEGWSMDGLSPKATGGRSGWWGASEKNTEAFLDQLVTWRELGYNMCLRREDYDRYGSLPDWAKKTLAQHAKDERPYVYTIEQFEHARTHDPLWNAAQMQLNTEGGLHNYLRMLWGKKILEWSASPQEALDIMIELNNKYGLDGRNPNSYSGVFWVLGRYDRPWGPERSVFGKIRYMSSENTARKVRVQNYIQKYAR
jgi:deoxyribodipyrimidine photo-lyase